MDTGSYWCRHIAWGALDRSQCDNPDLELAKRKRSCSPGTAHSSESSSPLQHTGRKHSCQTTVSLRNERKRLLYVMQQISDETIAAKIRKQLESDLIVSNSQLITSLSDIFDSEEYLPQSSKHLETCTDCGEEYDTHYNKLTSVNLCRQEHDVERTTKDVCGTGWECNKCGQMWTRECYYSFDTDRIQN